MIYYSHINEDNRVERKLLQQGNYPVVIAICGSGERVLSLMDNESVKNFRIVDNNKEAIYLLQLKIAALTHLSVDDYLAFIGHYNLDSNVRKRLLENFAPSLPSETYAYWMENKVLLENGVLNIGHFENFLQRVRPLIRAWLGKRFLTILDNQGKRQPFPEKRWMLLKKLFSYKYVYRLAGNRDIAFIGSNAAVKRIPTALDEIIKSRKASSSFMAHLIFNGHLLAMDEEDRPPSLQSKILQTIKERLLQKKIAISYFVSDLLEHVEHYRDEKQAPVFYSLSDILSFVSFNYLDAVISRISTQEACIITRSFLRNRLTDQQSAAMKQYGRITMNDDNDSSGMYQVCTLYTKTCKCL